MLGKVTFLSPIEIAAKNYKAPLLGNTTKNVLFYAGAALAAFTALTLIGKAMEAPTKEDRDALNIYDWDRKTFLKEAIQEVAIKEILKQSVINNFLNSSDAEQKPVIDAIEEKYKTDPRLTTNVTAFDLYLEDTVNLIFPQCKDKPELVKRAEDAVTNEHKFLKYTDSKEILALPSSERAKVLKELTEYYKDDHRMPQNESKLWRSKVTGSRQPTELRR